MRRRKRTEHANHERWLISYADFITLLFAFFVVMFAVSQSDKSKPGDVSASVKQAIEDGGVSSTLRSALHRQTRSPAERQSAAPQVVTSQAAPPAPTADGSQGDLGPSFRELQRQLKDEIDSSKLKITLEPRGIVISLRERAFFPSGEETINPAVYGSVEKIATLIGGLPNPVRLEGHTDSRPIHTSRFRNNWELSSARAVEVLLMFQTRFNMSPKRFAVAGYADNAPVADNLNDEGRAQNRRVDVVILSRLSLQTESPNQ